MDTQYNFSERPTPKFFVEMAVEMFEDDATIENQIVYFMEYMLKFSNLGDMTNFRAFMYPFYRKPFTTGILEYKDELKNFQTLYDNGVLVTK